MGAYTNPNSGESNEKAMKVMPIMENESISASVSLGVQVFNNHILTQNPKYPIIGTLNPKPYMDP